MQLEKRLDFPPELIIASIKDNKRFSQYTTFVLLGIVGSCVVYSLALVVLQYLRTLACLTNDNQVYFRSPQAPLAMIKKHLLYAPLFSRRHSEPVRIWGFEAGLLPTRFQSILFLGIIVMDITLATYGIEWSTTNQTLLLFHFRNRLGILALGNMIPLVFIAGRNNPFIYLTRLPYDTFNLVHRWLGHLVIALAFSHGVVEFYFMDVTSKKMHKNPVKNFGNFLAEERWIAFGFVAWFAMLVIFFTTFTAFRHAFYETFLHIHVVMVALILAAIWTHIEALPPLIMVKVIVAIWIVERLLRFITLLYRNLGRGGTQATVEAIPGEAMRITLRLARPFHFKPGQHLFLTLPTVGLWTNHPFSVAWSEHSSHPSSSDLSLDPASPTSPTDPEKGVLSLEHSRPSSWDESMASASNPTTVSLIIRRRGGFTERLYRKLHTSHTGQLRLPALVEGPYGGLNCVDSYGSVMLIAGGVGITHQVPFIRHLVRGYANGTVAARRVLLVWIIRSPEHLEWIRPWMTEILGLPKRREVLRIMLFVTRPRSPKEIRSPSATVQMFPGKPNVGTLVELECKDQVGAMCVGVCGPGQLGDDVRSAVREVQGVRNVDLLEESFGW